VRCKLQTIAELRRIEQSDVRSQSIQIVIGLQKICGSLGSGTVGRSVQRSRNEQWVITGGKAHICSHITHYVCDSRVFNRAVRREYAKAACFSQRWGIRSQQHRASASYRHPSHYSAHSYSTCRRKRTSFQRVPSAHHDSGIVGYHRSTHRGAGRHAHQAFRYPEHIAGLRAIDQRHARKSVGRECSVYLEDEHSIRIVLPVQDEFKAQRGCLIYFIHPGRKRLAVAQQRSRKVRRHRAMQVVVGT